MRKIFSVIMLCVCICACGTKPVPDAVLEPSERITVGILDFTLNSDDKSFEPYRKGLTDMFITELQKIPELQVVERTRLDAVMSGLGLTEQDKINPAKAGRLMDAQALFYGGLTVSGNMMRLDGRLVQVETGKVLASAEDLSTTSEIDDQKTFQMVARVSEKIAAKVKANHKILVADSFYSKGRNAEEHADRDSAIRYYDKALKYYPGHKPSQKALERLQIR